jgi:hypothetical protein
MKKYRFLIILTVLVFAIACNPAKRMQRQCAKCPQRDSVVTHDTLIQTYRDTVINFSADSSNLFALIRCDSTNKAYLYQLSVLSTAGINTVVYFKHDTLIVSSKIDSSALYLQLKDKYQSSSESKTKTITVVDKVYRFPWWGYFLWPLSLLIALYLGYRAGKFLKFLP